MAAPGGSSDDQLSVLFGQIGLNDQQTAAIDAGHAVAKVLSWGGPSEVFVFGAVHIDGLPETYLKLTRNVGRLSGTPGYLAIGELSATTSDLSGPTIRVNHGVVYRAGDATRSISAVAIKQLYASHYFHTALDVSICVADTKPQRRGFYLVTLKSSEQDGLTGAKGSILRKIAVSKTRSSLEKGLALIKDAVERSATAGRALE